MMVWTIVQQISTPFPHYHGQSVLPNPLTTHIALLNGTLVMQGGAWKVSSCSCSPVLLRFSINRICLRFTCPTRVQDSWCRPDLNLNVEQIRWHQPARRCMRWPTLSFGWFVMLHYCNYYDNQSYGGGWILFQMNFRQIYFAIWISISKHLI